MLTALCGRSSNHHTPFSTSERGGVNIRVSLKSLSTGSSPLRVSTYAAVLYSVSLSTQSGSGLNQRNSQAWICSPFCLAVTIPAPASAEDSRSQT